MLESPEQCLNKKTNPSIVKSTRKQDNGFIEYQTVDASNFAGF